MPKWNIAKDSLLSPFPILPPKLSIHKDGQFILCKDNIRISRKLFIVFPEAMQSLFL